MCSIGFYVNFAQAGPVMTDKGKRNQGDEQQQLQRDRQISEERIKRQKQKDVLLPSEKSGQDESLPQEEPSFLVKKIILTGSDASRFKWLQKKADHYSNRKIGQKGLDLINKRLGNLLIDRGYITTRAVIPEQDISKGVLYIQIVGGKIGNIRFAPTVKGADWKSAFPVKRGDLLNLRDLEQGLEQLQRVPSQNVDFQLVPGGTPGFTDIVIQIKRSRPDQFFLSIDNAGNSATGKLQNSFLYNIDNLIGKNDLFSINYSQDSTDNIICQENGNI